jgi:peptidyl-prolyl cis-trans isomerase D
MLDLMRRKASTWLIKIMLGAIVIVFVFWGVGSFRSQKANQVATVNGKPITAEDYREAYNNLLDQMRQRFGERLNEDMIKMLGLKQQALNQLIDQMVMRQEAQRLAFRVTDAELEAAIGRIKAFQAGGVFNKRVYRMVLSRYHMTPERFEVMQRQNMLIDKLRSMVASTVKVSEAEAQSFFNWQNAAVNLDYVRFDPASYKDIVPTDAAIKTFFEANKEKYKTQPLRKARYIRFNPIAYTSKVTVSDDDVAAYYDAHPDEFKTEKTVEARHILFKVDPKADPATVEAVRKKALEVLKLAREGKDFAQLAKKYSEGPSKDSGGYLGRFKRGDMVSSFSDKAFSMKAGQISDPVRTQFGWHLIKVEKIYPATTVSLKDATEGIKKKVAMERAKSLAYDDASDVYDKAYEGNALAAVAEKRNLKVETTADFDRSGPAGMPGAAKFAQAAFGLADKEISDIQDISGSYYLIQIIEQIAPRIPTLAEVDAKVRADWIHDQQKQRARQAAEALIAELKKGTKIADATAKIHAKLETTGFFKRGDAISGIGSEPALSQAGFSLSAQSPVFAKPIEGKKDIFVIRFRERKIEAPETFASKKGEITNQLLEQKQGRTVGQWLANIKKTSEIKIEKSFLDSVGR